MSRWYQLKWGWVRIAVELRGLLLGGGTGKPPFIPYSARRTSPHIIKDEWGGTGYVVLEGDPHTNPIPERMFQNAFPTLQAAMVAVEIKLAERQQ